MPDRSSGRMTHPRNAARRLRAPALVFIAYYVGAQLGFALSFPSSPVSTLWAPNALLLAAFLLTPARTWWILLLLGALPAHLAVELSLGVPLVMTACWFVSNTTEALLGAFVIRRFLPHPVKLEGVGAVGVFVLAATAATLLSSFLDAGFVALNDWGEATYWEVFRIRAFSNILATITLVPVVLAWSPPGAGLRNAPATRWLEAALLGAGLLTVSYFTFAGIRADSHVLPGLPYAPLPFLLWSVVRFGPRGSSTALLLVVLVAIWSAVHDRGPFLLASPEEKALTIQVLFITVAIMLMSLAAVIQERARAEESARRKGEQLQLALDSAELGMWNWRLDDERTETGGQPRYGGRGRYEDLAPFEQLLPMTHPADRDHVARAIMHAVEHGAPFRIEFRVSSGETSVRWVLAQGKVLHDARGRPVQLLGIHADITERKLAEARKSGETRILAMIAAGAPLAEILPEIALLVEAEIGDLLCSILLLDPDGVHVRHAAAPNLPESYTTAVDGLAIGPAAGSCGAAMHRRERVITADIARDPLWDAYRELALRHGLRACWSTPILSRNGKVLGSFACYFGEPRSPAAADLAMIDTAVQLAAIAIERQQAELEANQQLQERARLGRAVMLGQLSSALAHELNQPLSAIMTNAQTARRLLGRSPLDLAELRAIIDDIIASDHRARDVIVHLRAMLARGKQEFSPLDLHEVTTHALQLVRTDVTARQVSVRTDLSADSNRVMGDRVQLQQVILNLVMNACDAMAAVSPADRRLVLSTSVSAAGWVDLSVADRGSGIPPELIDRIFEPFFSSKEQGLGLGLSICRSIVAAHGGRLWVVNNPERGATFHVRLPTESTQPAPPRRARSPLRTSRDRPLAR
jgi:signal transduction histidine kinase/integral membrane sensor domain MASE1